MSAEAGLDEQPAVRADAIADGTVGELRAAVLILARRMRHQQAAGGLSSSEASTLGRVGRMGPVTPATLARCEHVQPPSMGRIIDKLEERGLVCRHRDPQDKRQVLVSRTAAGDEVAEQIRAKRTEWLACQFDRLDPSDQAVIATAAHALRRLAELT